METAKETDDIDNGRKDKRVILFSLYLVLEHIVLMHFFRVDGSSIYRREEALERGKYPSGRSPDNDRQPAKRRGIDLIVIHRWLWYKCFSVQNDSGVSHPLSLLKEMVLLGLPCVSLLYTSRWVQDQTSGPSPPPLSSTSFSSFLRLTPTPSWCPAPLQPEPASMSFPST